MLGGGCIKGRLQLTVEGASSGSAAGFDPPPPPFVILMVHLQVTGGRGVLRRPAASCGVLQLCSVLPSEPPFTTHTKVVCPAEP